MSPGSDINPANELEKQGGTAVEEEDEDELQEPRLYQVLLHNDDYTTMEFVVMILMEIFRHNEERAIEIMMSVHQKGVGVAGVYTREVAETKAKRVTDLAREHEFPLRCTLEPVI